MSQPCRQFGAVIPSQHAIPDVEIICYKVSVPQVVFQSLLCDSLASFKLYYSLQVLKVWLNPIFLFTDSDVVCMPRKHRALFAYTVCLHIL